MVMEMEMIGGDGHGDGNQYMHETHIGDAMDMVQRLNHNIMNEVSISIAITIVPPPLNLQAIPMYQ